MTLAEIQAALLADDVVSLTIWAEARSEPIEGQIAVGCVIRNRLPRYGGDYKAVCFAPKQFSCWNDTDDINHVQLLDYAQRFLTGHGVHATGGDLALRQCQWVAEGVTRHLLKDNTGGANHYYSPSGMVPKGRVPSWAKGKGPTAVIGRHRFYRLP